ncbi:MAG: CDP-glucose 4,6-dehydratase [Flavobacteriaceae bacterium]
MVEDLLRYKDKRVFITGHTGFKGSWLSYLLDKYGASVMGFSLTPTTEPSLFNNLNFSSSFKSVIGDIRDFSLIQKELDSFKPDYIFHLAAQPLVLESYRNPYETFTANTLGTLNVLEAIRKGDYSTTAIIVTTDKVYENLELNIPFKEDDKLGGKDPYSASKSAAEIITYSYQKSFCETNEKKIASVRAGNVIGGGDWSEDRLIPDLIKAHFNQSKVKIRNPDATRPWQHVLEPLMGYIELALKLKEEPKENLGAWNFGPANDDIQSVRQIVDKSIMLGFINQVEYGKPDVQEAKYLKLNISKAINKLNWKPIWNCEKSIEKTFNWYKEFYLKKNAEELIINDINDYLNDRKQLI